MNLSLLNAILDVIWFALAYDVVRALFRFVLELVLREIYQRKGGTHLERIVTSIDIPIAVLLFSLSITDVIVGSNTIMQMCTSVVVTVSIYRSFVKPHINPNSTL